MCQIFPLCLDMEVRLHIYSSIHPQMDPSPPHNSTNRKADGLKPRPRSRARKGGSKGTNSGRLSATPEPQRYGGESNGRRAQKKTHRTEAKDKRFGEVAKLIKRYIPITVNGVAVSRILHPQPQAQNESSLTSTTPKEEHQPKKLLKSEKLTIILAHVRKVIDNDPQQPLYLSFILIPSDPDFPFDLELLNFNLTIPASYPRNATSLPSLLVLNSDIPKGFAVNIERMYADIARLAMGGAVENPELSLVNGKGLLSQVQTLDKNLEHALKQEKRATVKFVSFKRSSPSPAPLPAAVQREHGSKPSSILASADKLEKLDKMSPAQPVVLKESQDTRRLALQRMSAKLGPIARLFHKSAFEERYKVLVPATGGLLPKLWVFENQSVDIFVSVLEGFPEVSPTVKIATNFSNNLMVAKKSRLEARGLALLTLVEEARTAEKNFRVNVAQWLNEQLLKERSDLLYLVTVVNWISNNLEWLLLSKDEYKEWENIVQNVAVTAH